MNVVQWVFDHDHDRWDLETPASGESLACITLKCEYRDRTRIRTFNETKTHSQSTDVDQLKRDCEESVRDTLSRIIEALDSIRS